MSVLSLRCSETHGETEYAEGRHAPPVRLLAGGVVVITLTGHNETMTTYLITARWGAMRLSEDMDVRSELSPENEIQYAENFMLDKWSRLFGADFINGADEITTEAVLHA